MPTGTDYSARSYGALRPLRKQLLIRPDSARIATDGGILIPETTRRRPDWGEVVALGSEVPAGGPEVGDRVFFNNWQRDLWTIGGVPHLLQNIEEIMAVEVTR